MRQTEGFKALGWGVLRQNRTGAQVLSLKDPPSAPPEKPLSPHLDRRAGLAEEAALGRHSWRHCQGPTCSVQPVCLAPRPPGLAPSENQGVLLSLAGLPRHSPWIPRHSLLPHTTDTGTTHPSGQGFTSHGTKYTSHGNMDGRMWLSQETEEPASTWGSPAAHLQL